VDPNSATAGLISQEGASAQKLGVQLVHFSTAGEAEGFVRGLPAGKGLAVVASPNVVDKPLRDLFASLNAMRPEADFYVVKEGAVSLADVQSGALKSLAEVPAPLSSAGIMLVSSKGLMKIATAAAPADTGDAFKATDVVALNDSEVVPIDAKKLLLATDASFDVFIRLGKDKYVKIVNKGEKSDASRTSKYIERGVKHFFITRESQEIYVRYCESLAEAVNRSNAVQVDKKLSITMNLGNEALSLLTFRGVSEENLRYASSFVTSLSGVVRSLGTSGSLPLTQYLAQSVTHQHSASLAASAGLMAKSLNLESEKSVQIIGMAATLHDIGLTILGFQIDENWDPSKFEGEDRRRYETHPTVGADELRKLKRFDATLVQAVEQHHLRRNGKGFPEDGNRRYIHICAEIIGICDELDYVIRQKLTKEPHLDIRRRMESVYDDFSRPVVQAFQNTFFRKTP